MYQLSVKQYLKENVTCAHFIKLFGPKARTLTQQNSRLFVSVLLQLTDLITENMKISKIVGKGGCVQHHFSKKNQHSDLLFLLAC